MVATRARNEMKNFMVATDGQDHDEVKVRPWEGVLARVKHISPSTPLLLFRNTSLSKRCRKRFAIWSWESWAALLSIVLVRGFGCLCRSATAYLHSALACEIVCCNQRYAVDLSRYCPRQEQAR